MGGMDDDDPNVDTRDAAMIFVTAGRSLKWKGHQGPEVRRLFHILSRCGADVE